MDKDKKDNQDQTADQDSKATPAITELVQTIKEQKAQIDQLLSAQKESQQSKEKEKADAEKAKLEKDSNLTALLKSMDDADSKDSKKSDLESLTNAELIELMGSSVERFFEAKAKALQEGLGTANKASADKLANVEKLLGQMIAHQSVQQIRERHPDFDDLRESIQKQVESTPGLSLEQAYKLAKLEAMENEPLSFDTDTEYPEREMSSMQPSSTRTLRPKDKAGDDPMQGKAQMHGVADFRRIVNAGLDKVLANRRR